MFGLAKLFGRKREPVTQVMDVKDYEQLLEDSFELISKIKDDNPNKSRMRKKLNRSFIKYKDQSEPAFKNLAMQLLTMNRKLRSMSRN